MYLPFLTCYCIERGLFCIGGSIITIIVLIEPSVGFLSLQQRKKESTFKAMLKSVDPPLTHTEKWEEVRYCTYNFV